MYSSFQIDLVKTSSNRVSYDFPKYVAMSVGGTMNFFTIDKNTISLDTTGNEGQLTAPTGDKTVGDGIISFPR